MIGSLDNDTYFARRGALQASIAAAQAEYDETSLQAELAEDLSFDHGAARLAKLELEGRLDALDRAWAYSEARRAAVAALKADDRRLANIDAAKALRKESDAAADEMAGKVAAALESVAAFMEVSARCGTQLTNITHTSPHQRRTLDFLAHNMVGPAILGKLQKAGLPSLEDLDPIAAMRAFEGRGLADVAMERIRKAFHSAAQDIPELEAD